ncbi:late competence development ComFB family protein [Baaleninema sp.]|uniref:late competence development ComFB family protein n=1 Tax=Baaleninema sp. TaxID=3101197 RepID=UPI003D06C5E8
MTTTPYRCAIYRNAMEPLAIEEVQRQLGELPPEVARSIDTSEAIAYALNRLPPLYATTVEGWTWNQERGRNSLGELIQMAVSWGIREAQRKRKPFVTPLGKPDESETALQALQHLLGCPDLGWPEIVPILEQRLHDRRVRPSFDRRRVS